MNTNGTMTNDSQRTMQAETDNLGGQHLESTRQLYYTDGRLHVSVQCVVGESDVDGLLDHPRVVIWGARENAGVLPVNRVAGRPHMHSQGN